jgi:hypothetical protein
MAFDDAGVHPSAWSIDGIDLSLRNVEQAQRWRYGDFSFRQTPAEVRQRYFQPSAGGGSSVPICAPRSASAPATWSIRSSSPGRTRSTGSSAATCSFICTPWPGSKRWPTSIGC